MKEKETMKTKTNLNKTWPMLQAEIAKKGRKFSDKHNAEVLAELDRKAMTETQAGEGGAKLSRRIMDIKDRAETPTLFVPPMASGLTPRDTRYSTSFIEKEVREYTDELLRDASYRGKDHFELARDIVIEIKRGFIDAMSKHDMRELACDLLNETDI